MSQPYVPNKKAKEKPPKPGIVAGLGYYVFYRVVFAIVAAVLTVTGLNTIWDVDFIQWYSSPESLPELAGPSFSYVLILGQIVALLAIWLVFLGRDKKFFKEISLNRIKPTVLWPLIPLGIGIGVFYNALLWQLSQTWTGSAQTASDALTSPEFFAMLSGVLLVLSMSVTSDVLYRGLVYTRFSRQLPRWAAMLGAGFLFALGMGQAGMIFYIAFGGLLCWVMDHYGSLWAPIVLQLSCYILGTLAAIPLLGIPPMVRLVLSAAVCALSIWFIKRQSKPEPVPEQSQGKTPQLR